jgi:GNAT superfamily N-acetyltransferase
MLQSLHQWTPMGASVSSIIVQPRIEQLAERPDLLSVVADWIYHQWWTSVDGASVEKLSQLLRAHLVLDQIPLTLVASLDSRPVGTATLLTHDVGTEEWPDLSPWLSALYVVPQYREHGIGTALVNATLSKATALGVGVLHLLTTEREEFYANLGWHPGHRSGRKVVMSKLAGAPQ